MGNKDIMPGYGINVAALRALKNEDIDNIVNLVEHQKLIDFLQVGKINQALVSHFFKSSRINEIGNIVCNLGLKKKEVIITLEEFAGWFNLPTEGTHYIDEDYRHRGWERMTGRKTVPSNPTINLLRSPGFRLLAAIVSKGIECQSSNHESLPERRINMMAAIVMKKEVNWAYIIFDMIKDCVRLKEPSEYCHARAVSILLSKIKGLDLHAFKDNWKSLHPNQIFSPSSLEHFKVSMGSAKKDKKSKKVSPVQKSKETGGINLKRRIVMDDEEEEEEYVEPLKRPRRSALPAETEATSTTATQAQSEHSTAVEETLIRAFSMEKTTRAENASMDPTSKRRDPTTTAAPAQTPTARVTRSTAAVKGISLNEPSSQSQKAQPPPVQGKGKEKLHPETPDATSSPRLSPEEEAVMAEAIRRSKADADQKAFQDDAAEFDAHTQAGPSSSAGPTVESMIRMIGIRQLQHDSRLVTIESLLSNFYKLTKNISEQLFEVQILQGELFSLFDDAKKGEKGKNGKKKEGTKGEKDQATPASAPSSQTAPAPAKQVAKDAGEKEVPGDSTQSSPDEPPKPSRNKPVSRKASQEKPMQSQSTSQETQQQQASKNKEYIPIMIEILEAQLRALKNYVFPEEKQSTEPLKSPRQEPKED